MNPHRSGMDYLLGIDQQSDEIHESSDGSQAFPSHQRQIRRADQGGTQGDNSGTQESGVKYEVGQEHERWTPFIVEDKELTDFDGEDFSTRIIKHWRPGINHEPTAPDDFEPVWDGEGAEIRRIVAVVTIEGGGVRILYRSWWRRPDGGLFGKPTVRMTTPSGFTVWMSGKNSHIRRQVMDRKERMMEAA